MCFHVSLPLHQFQNHQSDNLNGLSNLDSISGSLFIGSEYSLTSIAGLGGIASGSINNLGITNNGALTDCNIQSLCNYLASPNGIVTIYNNGSGCSNPGEIAIECDITLPCLPYGNYFFTNQSEIDSFQYYYPNCNNLNGEVLIRGADIRNLTGLNNVTSVSEQLVIAGNHRLLTLNGLDSLTSVGFYFYIGGLENVDGFWDLLIFDNPSLSNCAIESICSQLLENGYSEILNNTPGCDSKYEVIEACLGSVKEEQFLSKIIVSPNPFRTSVTIEYSLDHTSQVNLMIYNHLGKQVDLIQQNQQSGNQSITWQPLGLPQGMYYFTLQAGDQVATGKMVLMR